MNNSYIPKIVRIRRVVKETPDVKTFYFENDLAFIPGQFLELSCFGAGEAPISICSSPEEDFLKLSFRRAGCVTKGLFELKENDSVGMRGPFGNGFPLDLLKMKNILLIGGGIGLAPLRSLLKCILSEGKNKAGKTILFYGARSPQELLYKNELKQWPKDIELLVTVDKPDTAWCGAVGVVTELFNKIRIQPAHTAAFICGPQIMMRFSTEKLLRLGVRPSHILLSMERYMKCGAGKCGHCYIADKFVCRDGPVFTYEQLSNLKPTEILS